MKKVRSILLLVLTLGLSALVFAACGTTGGDKGGCKHEYDGACDEICNICGEERETSTDHTYTATGKDDTYHWTACSVCGAEEPDTRENHAYGPESGDGQHWQACDCGAEKPNSRANHSYEWKKEDGKHWKECSVCGEADPENPKDDHVYNWTSADGEHWKACVCGEVDPETEKAAHTYDWESADGKHWKECTACGEEDPATEKDDHDFEWKVGAEKHSKECVCGEVEVAETDHDYTLTNQHDAHGHWDECVCGAKANEDDHDADWEKEGDQHWMSCITCGYGKDESLGTHEYEWKQEEATHSKVCVCGAVEVEPAAHTYEFANGALSCNVCQKEGTVTDLTAENGYEDGYVYVDLEAGFTFVYSAELTETLAGYTIVDADGTAITTAGAGAYVYYAIKDGSAVAYKVPVYVATKVIKSPADMGVMFYSTAGVAIEGYYILGNDINYNNDTSLAKQAGTGMGDTGGFRGTFNGLGYTIKNYAQPNQAAANSWSFYSLFGALKGATICNVRFENVVISERNNSSLFGREVDNSTFKNITMTNVKFDTGTTTERLLSSGILCGYNLTGSNKFIDITIDMNGNELQALIGQSRWHGLSSATFENVKVYNVSGVRAIFARYWLEISTGVYDDGNLVGGKTHAEAYRDFPGLTIYTDGGDTEYMFVIPSSTVDTTFVTEGNNSVVLTSDKFVLNTAYYVNGKEYTTTVAGELSLPSNALVVGENTVVVAFQTEGSRVYDGITFTNVILATKIIKSVTDMDAVYYNGTTTITGYFVLGNDIDYENNTAYVKKYTAGETDNAFKGTFNGMGYTIRNYTQPENKNENQSLFGLMRNATVKNVNFDNVTISSYKASGIFARGAWYTTLENITIRDVKFTSVTAEGTANSAIFFGWWIGTTNKFIDIDIYLGTTGSQEGYLHNLIAGGQGDGSTATATIANSLTNVNVYNAKTVQWIIAQGSPATIYNSVAGLMIYSDSEGNTEYDFNA